jgi:pyruvate-formate lyase
MEAARDTQLPHHTISLRVHENSPLEVIVKALEVVKTGLGMPAFFGDKSFINYFINHNCDIEDARDYCITGCVDGAIPGKTRGLVGPQILVPQILDVFLHNGVSRHSQELVGIATGDTTTLETFDEFIAEFYKQLDYIIGLAAETANIGLLSSRNLTPDPFYSALMDDGVKSGQDIKDRNLKFDNAVAILPIGTVNATDSIAAIKTLIYEQKKYTMKELIDALDNNWEGKDDMRKDFITAPKYGNNHPVPDQIISDFYQHFYLRCNEIIHANGGPVTPSGLSVTSHQPGGKLVKASPDGRKAGDILAEGSVSPIQGKDVNGPLAVLQSAMKINQDPYQATLLNMKFHPSALKTEKDLYKLAMVIKTYLTNGGKHVQFNVVDKETLITAKKEPDKHKDLVVRVAGYSAYFTMLSPMVQDEVINRTTFDGA